ncbi:MAG: hypothetical protein AAB375_02665 [Patescibacteria group bacterium]
MTETNKEAPSVAPQQRIAISDEVSTRLQATALKLKLSLEEAASLAFSLLETIVDQQLFTRKDEKFTLSVRRGHRLTDIVVSPPQNKN